MNPLKTKNAMKQTRMILLIAALVAAGAMTADCSNLKEEQQLQEIVDGAGSGTVTLTSTIQIGGTPQTRALDAEGNKSFAQYEQIAVIYKNTSNETLKAISKELTAEDISTDGKHATITVTLSNPEAGSAVRYIYPAAMAAASVSTLEPGDEATVDYTKLDVQDGTLETLAASLDLAVFDGTLTASAGLPASASLTNLLTIGKFTIMNEDGSSDLTSGITGLAITDGTNTYAVSRTASAAPIFVAMKPIANSDVSLNASEGTKNYHKSVPGVTLVANGLYPITVKMVQGANLSMLSGNYEAQDGDVITGTLPGNFSDDHTKDFRVSIADKATVTLSDVTITNIRTDGYGQYAGITCKGDAQIILDGTNVVKGGQNQNPGILVPEGKTLTISGTGELTASPSANGSGAGIGGSYGSSGTGGNILINSGTINATSALGAGIGSSQYGSFGSITINGGTVNAFAEGMGAGIGAGGQGSCGDITITGGTVIARSRTDPTLESGAGIGGAYSYDRDRSCGNITINGGIITATGGRFGPGIGSGGSLNIINSCGTITITGGEITATGGLYAAGIGTGGSASSGDNNASLKCGAISISGGKVNATGGKYAAAIGTGRTDNRGNTATNDCTSVTITAGVTSVIATKGTDSPNVIGAGYQSTCGTVTIEAGANVTQN